MMSFLYTIAFVTFIVGSIVDHAVARDLSLYDVSFFDEYSSEQDAYIDSGSDEQQVHLNHPAMIAKLRSAMQGGPPIIFPLTSKTTNEAEGGVIPFHMIADLPESATVDSNDRVVTSEGTAAKQHVPPQRLLQQKSESGGLRGPTASLKIEAVTQLRGAGDDSEGSSLGQGPLAANAIVAGRVPSSLVNDERKKAGQFDFVVAGFPKCGTTSLLKTFATHPEIDMAAQEQCAIAAPVLTDVVVLQKLDTTLQGMPSITKGDLMKKRAFKCPNAMFTYKSIGRLEKHSPSAKLVVGIRHPVHMMQSFYNYRVTEIYERGLADTEKIPDFLELVSKGYRPWKLVSLAAVRFELFLQQLGKTVINPDQFAELSKYTEFGYELAIKPNNFTVFLYAVEQLEDTDNDRSAQLLADLQEYLGLGSSISPIGHENKNHAVGDFAYPESIFICEPKFASIRKEIIRKGIQTADWLRNHFLKSPDVYFANPDHFLAILETWSTDPCDDGALEEAMEEGNGDDDSGSSELDFGFDVNNGGFPTTSTAVVETPPEVGQPLHLSTTEAV